MRAGKGFIGEKEIGLTDAMFRVQAKEMEAVKNAIKVAYFCKHYLRDGLEKIRTKMGEKEFREALEKLESFSIIEYPLEYPDVSTDYPRGTPYSGVNYFLIRFVYYPAWVRGYMSYLPDLRKLMRELGLTRKIIEEVREEISTVDPSYKSLLEQQLNEVSSWNDEDKEVLEHLLDPLYEGKIEFSESTRYWNS